MVIYKSALRWIVGLMIVGMVVGAVAKSEGKVGTSFLSKEHKQVLQQGKEFMPVDVQVGTGKGWQFETADGYVPPAPTKVGKMHSQSTDEFVPQPDPPGYTTPQDSDLESPTPTRMNSLQKKLDKILDTLWVNATYDPTLDTIPSGDCEWYSTIFTTYLTDIPGDGGFQSANLHNNLGFTNLPGSIAGQGSLVWWFWQSGVVRSDVIDEHGNDIWPRWRINNLTQWKVQLVNRTMPFRPIVGRNGNLIHPRRCVTGRLVPIGTGNNGGQDWLIGEYGRRAEKIVSYGSDLVWPSNPSGDFNPWTEYQFIGRNLSEVPLRSRVLHERAMADYITQQNANPLNRFRFNTFNPKWHFHVGHSFGDASGKVNHAGQKGWNLGPHPFWEAPIYFAGVDGTPEAQYNYNFGFYNWTGIMLLTGNTMPDPQLPRALYHNQDEVGSAYVLAPKCYHQWCGQLGDCAFSVLAQLLDVVEFMPFDMLPNPGWYLDTCAADKSTWVNTLFDPIDLQTAHQLNFWMDRHFAIAFGLIPRVDPGHVGQYVPLGQQDAYFHYILSTKNLYATQGVTLPPTPETICYNGLNRCGVLSFENITTAVETAHGMHFHGYVPPSSSSYNPCTGYDGSFTDTSFSSYAGGNYGPVIANVTVPTHVWATVSTNEVCGVSVNYFQPTFAQLQANPACNCPGGNC